MTKLDARTAMMRLLLCLLLVGCMAALFVPSAALATEADGEPYDFWFTRLMYESGDWNVDQQMPSNVLTALIDYTELHVDPKEHVVAASDARLMGAPFVYLSGHKSVSFTKAERNNIKNYLNHGGFLFVDDCNHDIDGLFAKSFEGEMAKMFGEDAMQKLPDNHAIYQQFFAFDEPPTTTLELNGWGDDLVHDYLKAIHVDGRVAVLYSNKDYGCEWDYHFRNKRWLASDNTRFAVNLVLYSLMH